MREIVTLRRLFFLFLGSMRLATGRPVGQIVAINGSNPIQSNPMSITEAGQGLYFRLFLKFKIQKHK